MSLFYTHKGPFTLTFTGRIVVYEDGLFLTDNEHNKE